MPDWRVIFGDTPAWQVILWLAAVCTVIYLLVKLWPFVTNAVAIVNAIVGLPALAKQVKEIHHETHRNDGTSLKDAVDRVEATANETAQSVEGLHGRMDDVDRQLTSLAHEDEAIWAEIENTNNPADDEP